MNEIDPDLFASQCVLTKSRRAARAVSRYFAQLLAPHGLTSSQASTLFVLSGMTTNSISDLADTMGVERSGLTRNLKLLEKAGYIECEIAGRGGAKSYRLSKNGKQKLIDMIPLWHQAQDSLRETLGDDQWQEMQRSLTDLSEI